MVKLYEEHRIIKYINAAILVGGIYLLAAAPYVIGMVGKNSGLEKKVECVNTK